MIQYLQPWSLHSLLNNFPLTLNNDSINYHSQNEVFGLSLLLALQFSVPQLIGILKLVQKGIFNGFVLFCGIVVGQISFLYLIANGSTLIQYWFDWEFLLYLLSIICSFMLLQQSRLKSRESIIFAFILSFFSVFLNPISVNTRVTGFLSSSLIALIGQNPITVGCLDYIFLCGIGIFCFIIQKLTVALGQQIFATNDINTPSKINRWRLKLFYFFRSSSTQTYPFQEALKFFITTSLISSFLTQNWRIFVFYPIDTINNLRLTTGQALEFNSQKNQKFVSIIHEHSTETPFRKFTFYDSGTIQRNDIGYSPIFRHFKNYKYIHHRKSLKRPLLKEQKIKITARYNKFFLHKWITQIKKSNQNFRTPWLFIESSNQTYRLKNLSLETQVLNKQNKSQNPLRKANNGKGAIKSNYIRFRSKKNFYFKTFS